VASATGSTRSWRSQIASSATVAPVSPNATSCAIESAREAWIVRRESVWNIAA
jgi:hypothetical protein